MLLLSLIEGITEFIPVSSTGHLILTHALMGSEPTDFTKAFDVIIQFGAILAVVYLYREKLKWNPLFYRNVLFAFIPTAVLGFIFKDVVDQLFENNSVIAFSLILGGIVLVAIDNIFKNRPEKPLTPKSAFLIGLFQSVAMIPGVSRSAATIIGGRLFGLNPEKAAEFSFILAIPTMGAATAYKLWKVRELLEPTQATHLGLGVLFSFVFAILAIKFFISIVNRYGFKYFGYYRIALGILVLILIQQGVL